MGAKEHAFIIYDVIFLIKKIVSFLFTIRVESQDTKCYIIECLSTAYFK